MVQHAIKVPIPQRQMEHSMARETSHSAGVSALLVVFRLLAIVGAGCRLAAFIHSSDSSILLGVFHLASN